MKAAIERARELVAARSFAPMVMEGPGDPRFPEYRDALARVIGEVIHSPDDIANLVAALVMMGSTAVRGMAGGEKDADPSDAAVARALQLIGEEVDRHPSGF